MSTDPAGVEVTGLDQSIMYAEHLAAQAGRHGPDGNEAYLARLAACRVTGGGLTSGRAMQDAFAAAAAAATAHAHELARQKSVQEQYDMNPDAGDKTYLTDTDGTGPAAAADTAAAHTGPATARTVRDMLARGAYIAKWSKPQWQRDQARKWDAGRVDPEQRAAAYAHADGILAARTEIAAGPGAERMKAMRDHGILRCPPWCPQDPDEHEHEAHIGPDSTFTTDDGITVTVRPRVSWWADTDPTVELDITPAEGGGAIVLTAADLDQLQQLSGEVLDDARRQHHDPDPDTGNPAYPGAYSETADTHHAVTDPATAAAALDLQEHASSYYLTEDDDGPYLDWSTQPQTGVRNVEVGDGADAVALVMDTPTLRQLHDGIGRLVSAVDDGVPDPGVLLLDDEDDGAYIDWSTTDDDGVRYIDFGDGTDSVQIEFTDTQLREFHQRLGLQLHLDAQDADR